MVMRSVAIWVLACVIWLPGSAVATDDLKDVETKVQTLYEHKLFSLKNPNSAKLLEFDSSGKLVSDPSPGPWSTCGLLRVEKISISSNHLEVAGKRVILALRVPEKDVSPSPQPTQLQVNPVLIDRKIRVVMNLASPPSSVESVNNMLAQAFEGGKLLDRVANYWKPRTTDLQSFRKNSPDAAVGELEGGRLVYLVNPGSVQAPKPIHTPDPEYTSTAREKRLTGNATLLAVINEQGVPEVLEVVKGLGEGLDTQALRAVADWRFKPALKNGEPVAVAINVEVTFKLY